LLTGDARTHEIIVPASYGQKIAWLHAHGDVLEDIDGGEGADGPTRKLVVRLTAREFGRYSSMEPHQA